MAPDLDFHIENVEVTPFCVVPTLTFKLGITDAEGLPIHAVALDCQVRIEAQKRTYDAAEKDRLVELFGAPADWSRTLKSLLWTHTSASVAPFRGSTTVDLQLPCTYDFNVIAAKYFHGLLEGEVPLLLLFSGSIFYAAPAGDLQVARISWMKEASYRLPVQAWKDLMEAYYPNTAWLSLRRDTFDRLAAFKAANTLPTWERALEALLEGSEVPAER